VASFVRVAEASQVDTDASKLSVVVRKALRPVQKVIWEFIQANPEAPLEVAIRSVPVVRRTHYEDDCPAVRSAYSTFSAAAKRVLDPTSESRGFYHGPMMQIEGYTDGAFFSFHVEEGSALFEWAIEAADQLSRCETS